MKRRRGKYGNYFCISADTALIDAIRAARDERELTAAIDEIVVRHGCHINRH